MEELTLERLTPYLPYGLKCQKYYYEHHTPSKLTIDIVELKGICMSKYGIKIQTSNKAYSDNINSHKPILRPLSDYTKIDEILDEFSEKTISLFRLGLEHGIIDLPYNVAVLFFKNHIDLFNLIPQGLAIDINTINELK